MGRPRPPEGFDAQVVRNTKSHRLPQEGRRRRKTRGGGKKQEHKGSGGQTENRKEAAGLLFVDTEPIPVVEPSAEGGTVHSASLITSEHSRFKT